MSWRDMSTVVPDGEPPRLDPGEMWFPESDRVVAADGRSSYQVRRPGMCSLCPQPGRLLQLECAAREHRWTQALCEKHEGFCHPSGEVSCLQHQAHVDAMVVGPAAVRAEGPELITGGRPTGVPPVEVIAARLAMIVGPYPTTRAAEPAAAAVLTALALEGWEVTRRADRFATLERDATRLRIPLRGTCGACHEPVDRVTELVGADAELLISPWQHSYRQGTHPDTEIRDVTPR